MNYSNYLQNRMHILQKLRVDTTYHIGEFADYLITFKIREVFYFDVNYPYEFITKIKSNNDIRCVQIPANVMKNDVINILMLFITRTNLYLINDVLFASHKNKCIIMNDIGEIDDMEKMYNQTQKLYTQVFSQTCLNLYRTEDNCMMTDPKNINNQNNALLELVVSLAFFMRPYAFSYKKNTFPLTEEIVKYVFHPRRMNAMATEYGMEMCEFIESH